MSGRGNTQENTTMTNKTLNTVAHACNVVAVNLWSSDEHTHSLKKLTLPGGKAAFRFNMTVLVNGEPVEVHVKSK